jgi:hypothetical protein
MPRLTQVPSLLEAFHDKLLDGLDFCRLAYSYFDEIAGRPNGGHVLRERKGPIKQLIEELLPICRYVQTFYGPGQYISVRWMHGNQAFDAKVKTIGALVDHGMWPSNGTLEVTQAVHENEHLLRELLNTKGGGFGLDGLSAGKGKRGEREILSEPTSYNNQSYINDMCAIVLKAIEAKIAKMKNGEYPEDTTLIVDCVLMTIFLPDEWEKLVLMVKANLSTRSFRQIFLTAGTYRYSAVI